MWLSREQAKIAQDAGISAVMAARVRPGTYSCYPAGNVAALSNNSIRRTKCRENQRCIWWGAQCTPELDEEFNRWYDETHIPMLLKSPWLGVVTRYKLAPVMEGDYPEYLVICEFKSQQAFEAWVSGPEVHAAREELKETWKGKELQRLGANRVLIPSCLANLGCSKVARGRTA